MSDTIKQCLREIESKISKLQTAAAVLRELQGIDEQSKPSIRAKKSAPEKKAPDKVTVREDIVEAIDKIAEPFSFKDVKVDDCDEYQIKYAIRRLEAGGQLRVVTQGEGRKGEGRRASTYEKTPAWDSSGVGQLRRNEPEGGCLPGASQGS
jgi:hypothetical protein